MSEPTPSRDVSFDAFRGVAILLVVAAHAGVVGWDFRYSDAHHWNFYYSVFVRQVILCAVPIFLYVSGYWLAGMRIETLSDYLVFLKRRLSRILIPYLVWSSFFYTVHVLRGQPFSVSDFLFKLLTGQVEGLYFFLVMLPQFYLLTPLFVRLSRARWSIWAVIIVHALCVGALYGLRLGYAKDIPFTYIKIPFLSWLSFFYLGIYFRQWPGTLQHAKAAWLAGTAALFLFLSLVEGGILIHFDYFEFGISDIKYTTLLYSAAVLVLFATSRQRVRWPRFLTVLGDYSFGIYLIHGFITRVFHRALMPHAQGLYNVQPLYQALIVVAVILFCCGIVYVTREVVGKTWASKVLGF